MAWIEGVSWCRTSYPLDHVLDVNHRGRFLLHIAPQSMIYSIMFLNNARQIAVQWGFPHESNSIVYELYDLRSGRKVAAELVGLDEDNPFVSLSLGKNAPQWAKDLEAGDGDQDD